MVLILVGLLLFQQPAFEVASVKPRAPGTRFINTMLTYPGGRIVCQGCTLGYLLMEAFGIQPFQISGGPGWQRDDRFDLEAKPAAGSRASHANPPNPKLPMSDDQRQMLQELLADRFALKYHRGEREGAVYLLTRGTKKLKLEPAKDKDAYPWAGSPEGGAFASSGVAGTNITMPKLAARLSQVLERPVIDRSGLEGPYDFKYEYTSDDASADRVASILMSMQQVGLKLESGKGPVATIVIDHVEKPSGNWGDGMISVGDIPMTRMLISLEDRDKQWLVQKAQETGKPMSEVVRETIRQAQAAEQKPMKELLASTKGLWRKGDGLRYQRRIREEWR